VLVRFGKRARDNIIFFAGLAGLSWETIAEHSDRPFLLAVFAGMLGLDVLSEGWKR